LLETECVSVTPRVQIWERPAANGQPRPPEKEHFTMRTFRLLTAMFSIAILAACGSLSPTAADGGDTCDDPEVEECGFGVIGSGN